MKVHYRILENGIEIVRCLGLDSKVVIPKMIEGKAVIKVAPYAFSSRKATEELDVHVCEVEDSISFGGEEKLLAGLEVEEIILPDTVEEIGRYIFYGCRNLRSLQFSSHLKQVGSGAFTVCSGLSRLKVYMKEGKQSCVKEILGELWQRMDVIFSYEDGTEAHLVFPEHYEEAVENTPARLLYTHHHGSGNNYRQCFYNKELDYRKYDELFSMAVVMDDLDVLIDLSFGRLEFPYELTKKNELEYINYIRCHLNEIVKYLIQEKNLHRLRFISEKNIWSEEIIEEAVDFSAQAGETEILSFLMNEQHKLFPKKKKRFEL